LITATRDRTTPLLWAGACAAATLWIGVAAFHIDAVTTADERALVGFSSFAGGATTKDWATTLSHLTGPSQTIVLGMVLLVVAALRGSPRLVLAVATLLVGANLTTQLLQRTVEGHRYPDYLPDSIFPSGHATSAMSLAVCAVLVAPRAAKGAVAVVAGIGVIAIAFSILFLGQHHPSDVLAAITVTGAWTGVALHLMRPHDAAPEAHGAHLAVLAGAAVVALTAAIAVLARLRAEPISAAERASFVVGSAVIAASVLVLTFAARRASS
jgi:membrane-associated phospholipid phosphatase